MRNHLFLLAASAAQLASAIPTFVENTDDILNNPLVERSTDPDRVLLPSVHWSVNPQDISNIEAQQDGHFLYYAEDGVADPSSEHHFGYTLMNFTIPAVNLDNTETLSLTAGDADGIVTFASDSVFEAARASWEDLDELLMLTHAPICGSYYTNDFCYVLAKNVSFDQSSLTASAATTIVSVDDYLVSTTFEWGVYTPIQRSILKASSRRRRSNEDCNTVNGLPTVKLGKDFDERLDKCLGHTNASSFAWYDYAQSLGADQETQTAYGDLNDDMDGTVDLIDFKSADALAAAQATKTAAAKRSAPTSIVKRTLVDLNKRNWLKWVPVKIPAVNKPISKDFKKDLSWSLPKNRTTDDSPWGKAKLLKKYSGEKATKSGSASASGEIAVYCVNCGTDGSVTIYGKGSYSVATGLTEGFVTVSANMNAGLSLGLHIEAKLSATSSTQLAALALPGLNFGIIAVGPLLTLGADFQFNAEAEGKLLAGAKFAIQNAQSRLDFVNPQSSGSSGWTPQLIPIFEASGEVKVAAELGLPIGLSVGINISNGKFVKSVGIIDRPALGAKAEFEATANTTSAGITETDGCTGVSTEVFFKNELFGDLLGSKKSLMTPYVKNLAKGCIKIPGTSQSSSSSSAASSATPAAKSSLDSTSSGDMVSGFLYTNTSSSSVNASISSTQTSTAATSSPSVVKNPTIAAEFSSTHESFHGYNTSGTGSLEYTELVDSTSKYFLTACPDANIYVQPRSQQSAVGNDSCARVFESHNSTVVGDAFSRLFHYYGPSMDAYGVSRLRAHKDNAIPNGAVFVSFSAYTNSSGTLVLDSDVNNDAKGADAYYVASDSNNNQFFAAVCAYTDPTTYPSKVFLIKDQDAGLVTLASTEVQTSVTGGQVDQCYLIPFMQPTGEKGAKWNDQWAVDQTSEGESAGDSLENNDDF